jgi:hypothetical protein
MSVPTSSTETGARPAVSIPVIADSLPRGAWNDLARCLYFTITAEDPGTNWFLQLGGFVTVPFLMLGLEGIVFRPIQPDAEEFTDPDLLDELIRVVEGLDGFTVETEYLWLPTALLDKAWLAGRTGEEVREDHPDRGTVFRVDSRLFTRAFRAARDGTDFGRFAAFALDQSVGEGPNAAVRYSPLETGAIRKWSEGQVRASENFVP